MKLFPVHSVIWSSLLVLWFPQSGTEGHTLNVCQGYMDDEYELAVVRVRNSTGWDSYEELTDVGENFICLLHPTNELNCSWSFHTLETDTQLSVYVSVCDEEIMVESLNRTPAERLGSVTLTLSEYLADVILHFNMSRQDRWTSYTYVYDTDMLELLSPPPNIAASVKDGDLIVTWDLPRTREVTNPYCFEYQLDIGDQEEPKYLIAQQSYRKATVDPTSTYRVRMKTRITNTCFGSSQWSEWSDTVSVILHNESTDS